jgi:hypothetical protein
MALRKASRYFALAAAMLLPLAGQTISTEILGPVTDPTG